MYQDNQQIQDVLNQLLADLNILRLKINQTRWYVRGQNLSQISSKLMTLTNQIDVDIENLAERIITINGKPLSTYREFLSISNLAEEKGFFNDSFEDIMEILSINYQKIHAILIQALKITTEAKDELTHDMLINITKNTEQTIKFLNSSLDKSTWD